MQAEDRLAARALLVTPAREVLLMQAEVAPGRLVWFAPGGGLNAGETPSQAVLRETFEETGRRFEPGIPVWTRTHTFELEQRRIRQSETFFLVPTARFEPQTHSFEDLERRFFRGYRWWGIDEIVVSPELFAPRRLGELLRELLERGPAPAPIDAGI